MADFLQAIPLVLLHEGGYVFDTDDAGGETNFGISKRSYPALDIANLTVDHAKAIYKRDFWDPLQLDQVNDQAVATKVFDTAVLVGHARAVRFLQQAVQMAGGGVVVVDGRMGPKTLAAVNACIPLVLLTGYRKLLCVYYEGLAQEVPTDAKFLHGWLNRANA